MRKEILFLTGLVLSVFVMSAMVSAASFATTTASVTVSGTLEITLSNIPITFGDTSPGTVAKLATNNPLYVTSGSTTNVKFEITTKADGNLIHDSTHEIALSNLKWFTTTVSVTDYSILDSVSACGVLEGHDQSCVISHQLTVPTNILAGPYSTGITVTATKVP